MAEGAKPATRDEAVELAAKGMHERLGGAITLGGKRTPWEDVRGARRKIMMSSAEPVVADIYDAIYAAGLRDGKKTEFLENQTFVQCPACPRAIHVPVIVTIVGDPGHQEFNTEVDTTELSLHVMGHKEDQ